uniref:Protein kinase domain-containing protein n=1 Tax=Sander lucioperca TaxID=283035 RepID=A0A8C9Y914_SANLU
MLFRHVGYLTIGPGCVPNYLLGAVIGNGGYGTVYKATCLKTGQEFALKCYKRGVEDATVRELSCLSALQGQPHVIQMFTTTLPQDSR